MKIPKYFYFRVRVINKGTGVEIEEASDVDVVEVVRCKDCVYFDASEKVCVDMMTADENGYCAWGERRGEWQEPDINPCRGCDDYDGQGGCKSNGGCGTWIKMDEVTE